MIVLSKFSGECDVECIEAGDVHWQNIKAVELWETEIEDVCSHDISGAAGLWTCDTQLQPLPLHTGK